MARLLIYVSRELKEQVKNANLPVSKVCQNALIKAIREKETENK